MLRRIVITILLIVFPFACAFRSMLCSSLHGLQLRRASKWMRVLSTVRSYSTQPAYETYERFGTVQQFGPSREEVLDTIKRFGTDIREDSEGRYQVKECKLCHKGNRDKPDNLWKLTVWPEGTYNCFRCSSSGSYSMLKEKACELPAADTSEINVFPFISSSGEQISASTEHGSGSGLAVKPKAPAQTPIPNQTNSYKPFHNLFPDEAQAAREGVDNKIDREEVLTYLNSNRGLRSDVLCKYGVGFAHQEFLSNENVWEDHLCVTFPWQIQREELNGLNVKFSVSGDADGKADRVIVRTKYRALATKGLQRMSPKGGMWGMFGWHLVPPLPTTSITAATSTAPAAAPAAREIIITEGEYDAMAVHQGLLALPEEDPLRHVPAVSLPNGCGSLPPALLPQLASFTKIYLWLDNDQPGQDAAAKFVAKLGAHRCVVVKPPADHPKPPKDANDALRLNDSSLIPTMLRSAQPLPQEAAPLVSFADKRASVLRALASVGKDGQEGSRSSSLPSLNAITKGFRRGEMVIFTGPTGSGKTTLLSQLGIDFAQQGHPTLWGSFEVKTEALMGKMMQQYHKGGPLRHLSPEVLQQVANDFEALPIQFLNFHGASNINEIIAAMDMAVEKYGIEHIIIDNLQFMMPRSTFTPTITIPTAEASAGATVGEDQNQGNGEGADHATGRSNEKNGDIHKNSRGSSSGTSSRTLEAAYLEKFQFQDAVLDRLRAFATQKNVNIILVIHPRKEEEGSRLTLSSIFGTAKATQEADMVLILQRLYEKTFLEVKKNRYDGTTGRVDITFNPNNKCYEEKSTRRYAPSNSSAAATAAAPSTFSSPAVVSAVHFPAGSSSGAASAAVKTTAEAASVQLTKEQSTSTPALLAFKMEEPSVRVSEQASQPSLPATSAASSADITPPAATAAQLPASAKKDAAAAQAAAASAPVPTRAAISVTASTATKPIAPASAVPAATLTPPTAPSAKATSTTTAAPADAVTTTTTKTTSTTKVKPPTFETKKKLSKRKLAVIMKLEAQEEDEVIKWPTNPAPGVGKKEPNKSAAPTVTASTASGPAGGNAAGSHSGSTALGAHPAGDQTGSEQTLTSGAPASGEESRNENIAAAVAATEVAGVMKREWRSPKALPPFDTAASHAVSSPSDSITTAPTTPAVASSSDAKKVWKSKKDWMGSSGSQTVAVREEQTPGTVASSVAWRKKDTSTGSSYSAKKATDTSASQEKAVVVAEGVHVAGGDGDGHVAAVGTEVDVATSGVQSSAAVEESAVGTAIGSGSTAPAPAAKSKSSKVVKEESKAPKRSKKVR